MAKRRKKRHGHRRGGKFGFLDFKKHVKIESVAAGAAVGLGAGALIKYGVSQSSLQQSLPVGVQNNMIALGALAGGGIMYLMQKRKDHAAAVGAMAGAVGVAAVVTAYDYATSNVPQLSGLVEVTLQNGLRAKALKGLLIANPAKSLRGMIVRNPEGAGLNTSPYVGAGEHDPMDADAP